MSKTSTTRRRVTTVSAGLAVFLGASVAFAAWTTNSQPWANGATGQATGVPATAQVAEPIFPGYCEDVSITVTNNNPVPVRITSLGNTGFRNVSDTAPSETGKANRLEDFLTQADKSTALSGKTVGAGATKTFTVPNAVCLSGAADDARQAKTFEAGYFVAYELVAGNEAP